MISGTSSDSAVALDSVFYFRPRTHPLENARHIRRAMDLDAANALHVVALRIPARSAGDPGTMCHAVTPWAASIHVTPSSG